MRKSTNQIIQLIFIVMLSVALTACSKSMALETDYTTVSEPALHAGESIPQPKSEPILTVYGKINADNVNESIVMDKEALEAAGVVSYTVVDPFEERPIEFEGVLLRDLLDLWQIDDDATSVKLIALNDYHTDIAIEEIREYPIMVALKSDGNYMTPDYRGPALIVYPLHNYEFDIEKVHSNWIWQLTAIEVQ